MQGVKDANVLRAAAHSALRMRQLPNVNWGAGNAIASALVRRFVVDHADALAVCGTVGYRVERATRISRAQFAAVAFVVSQSSVNGGEMWDEFVTDVRDGVLLDETSPAYALRRWAINYNAPANSMQKQQTTVSVIAKAWNAYVQERPIKVLAYKYGIELPMPLPVPSPR